MVFFFFHKFVNQFYWMRWFDTSGVSKERWRRKRKNMHVNPKYTYKHQFSIGSELNVMYNLFRKQRTKENDETPKKAAKRLAWNEFWRVMAIFVFMHQFPSKFFSSSLESVARTKEDIEYIRALHLVKRKNYVKNGKTSRSQKKIKRNQHIRIYQGFWYGKIISYENFPTIEQPKVDSEKWTVF